MSLPICLESLQMLLSAETSLYFMKVYGLFLCLCYVYEFCTKHSFLTHLEDMSMLLCMYQFCTLPGLLRISWFIHLQYSVPHSLPPLILQILSNYHWIIFLLKIYPECEGCEILLALWWVWREDSLGRIIVVLTFYIRPSNTSLSYTSFVCTCDSLAQRH